VTITHDLTSSEFDDLFDVARSITRLEAQPAYAVGGAEQQRIDAYRAGRPRPLRNVVTDPWLARIAHRTISDGARWKRLRVVDEPLTDYQRYQLASHREAQAVGEEVRIARRSDVGDVGPDFWLFDDRRVVVMHYHLDGSLDRRELREDRQTIDACTATLARVDKVAIPLNEFLAALDA
jgi:hypothetical protein